MDNIRTLMVDAIQKLNPGTTVDSAAPLGKVAEQLHDDILRIPTLSFEVVEAKPTTGIKTNVIYLVPRSTALQDNIYEEWIYTNSAWELIGTTQLDISGKMNLIHVLSSDDTSALSIGQIFQYGTSLYVKVTSTSSVAAQRRIPNTSDIPKALYKTNYTLLSSSWSNQSQTLDLSSSGYTVTANTKVDIQIDSTACAALLEAECAGLYVNNSSGVLTVYAYGEAPTSNITVQLTLSEVISL